MNDAILKWLGKQGQSVSPEVQADRELIERETRKEELENLRADCRAELERDDITPARREAIHALLRETFRKEGYRDDLVFSGGVWRQKQPE